MMRLAVLLLLLLAPSLAAAQLVAATALLGAKVLDAQGKRLGHVDDLVLERHSGEVRYAVVFGPPVRAVALEALRPAVHRDRLVLDESARSPGAAAPDVPLVRAKTLIGAEVWDLIVDLGAARVVSAVLKDESGERRTVPFAQFAARFTPSRWNAYSGRAPRLLPAALGAQPALAASASELIGKYVVDPARADLGRVQDLVIDLKGSRVLYAVLGFGGWAGIFDKQFAIPIQEFTPAPASDKLVLARAKDILLLEPGIDSTGIPDGQAEYWRGIDRWYARPGETGLPLRQYARAQVLLGRDVVDRTGEEIGRLADLQVDLASGEITHALLALEGDMRRVPLSMLTVPASGAAIVYHG